MAQILVRNLDEEVVARLKERAKTEGRSLQAEVRMLLEQAASAPIFDRERAKKALEEIHEMFKGRTFSDSAELIREDRDR